MGEGGDLRSPPSPRSDPLLPTPVVPAPAGVPVAVHPLGAPVVLPADLADVRRPALTDRGERSLGVVEVLLLPLRILGGLVEDLGHPLTLRCVHGVLELLRRSFRTFGKLVEWSFWHVLSFRSRSMQRLDGSIPPGDLSPPP